MHEIYKWPAIDDNAAPAGDPYASENAFTVIGPAVDSAQRHAFLDMNVRLASQEPARQRSEEAQRRDAVDFDAAIVAAKEEGRQAAQHEEQDAIAKIRLENETLAKENADLRAALKAYGESTATLPDQLFASLLSRIGHGRLKMDLNAWMLARQMLLAKLDPQRAIDIMVGRGEESELAQALATPISGDGRSLTVGESKELPMGEMRASDGKHTWSVSVRDLAQALAEALLASSESARHE